MTNATAETEFSLFPEQPKEIAKKRPGAKRWPKLHLIYFVLAFFDLLAIGGGLYLSHRLSSVFEKSVTKSEEWSERFVAIWQLGDLALALNAPGNDVFLSRDVTGERAKLEAAEVKLDAAITEVRKELSANVPATLASHPLKTLTFVDQAMKTMIAHSNRTLTEYGKGNIERAAETMALMDRSFVVLKQKLNSSILAIRQIQDAYGTGFKGQVADLKRYEYLIGGAILLLVSCVLIYGHWIGRVMSRKFGELEAAHEESRVAEEAAKDYAGQLQTINEDIARLNRELDANYRRLREAQDDNVRKGKLAQLGHLTATVAHELRNPLGAVRTSVFLLERKVKGKALGIEAQLERINNGVTRCDDIISQLLDFARTKSLQSELLAFDDWLSRLIEEEAQRLPEAVEIECHLGLGEEKVTFDPARMSRVLINLLSNASEALVGKGDDPAKFAVASPRIVVASKRTARGIEISIADNGLGISEENLKKIFEPLFTTKSFGTGLGLPAVEKILEQHGGGLEVSSTQGNGAVFTAWFPHHAAMELVV